MSDKFSLQSFHFSDEKSSSEIQDEILLNNKSQQSQIKESIVNEQSKENISFDKAQNQSVNSYTSEILVQNKNYNGLLQSQNATLDNKIQKLNLDLQQQQQINQQERQTQIQEIFKQLSFLSIYHMKPQPKTQLHLRKQQLYFIFDNALFQEKIKFLQNLTQQFQKKNLNQTFNQQKYDFSFNLSKKQIKQTRNLSTEQFACVILSCILSKKIQKKQRYKKVKQHMQDLAKIQQNNLQTILCQQIWRYIVDRTCSIQTNEQFVSLTINLYLEKIKLDRYSQKVELIFESYKHIAFGQEIKRKINQNNKKMKKISSSSNLNLLDQNSIQSMNQLEINCQKLSQIDDYCQYSLRKQGFMNQVNLLQSLYLKEVRLNVPSQYHRFLKRFDVTSMQYDFSNRENESVQYNNECSFNLNTLQSDDQNNKRFYLTNMLECFCLKQSYMKSFNKINIQPFLKVDWSCIKILDLSNSDLIDQEMFQLLLKGNWKHLKGLVAWKTKITTLNNTNLHQLQNVLLMSFTYNNLDVQSVKYLISHKWPYLVEFRISFIDGDISWPLLLKNLRSCFPNLRYLGVRQMEFLDLKTVEFIKQFRKTERNLQIGIQN